jgi:spore coat protein A
MTVRARGLTGANAHMSETAALTARAGSYLQQAFLPTDMCLMGPDMWGSEPRVNVHLHGGHTYPQYDGHPYYTLLPGENWTDIYPARAPHAARTRGSRWLALCAQNRQRQATIWYHDHTMGSTRLNVLMGLAGAYVLLDPAYDSLSLPSGAFDIPLVFADRNINQLGNMVVPSTWQMHTFGEALAHAPAEPI